jgi:hypothetical protein
MTTTPGSTTLATMALACSSRSTGDARCRDVLNNLGTSIFLCHSTSWVYSVKYQNLRNTQ